MSLYRMKNGQLGQSTSWKSQQMGATDTVQAVMPAGVAPAPSTAVKAVPVASYSADIQLSAKSLSYDQAYWQNQEVQRQAKRQAQAAQKAEKMIAQKNRDDLMRAQILESQKKAPKNATETLLSNYWVQDQARPESARVIASIKPDFYDREMVQDGYEATTNPSTRSGDFRMLDITGNPLTRDGRYSPTTDWDRFAQAGELANDIAQGDGSTILRRMPRENRDRYQMQMGRAMTKPMAKAAMTKPSGMGRMSAAQPRLESGPKGRRSPMKGLGDWTDSVSDWFGDLADSSQEQLAQQLPGALTTALTNQLAPKPATTSSSGSLPAPKPIVPTKTLTAQLGVPSWALYSVVGLLAVSAGLVAFKTFKKA